MRHNSDNHAGQNKTTSGDAIAAVGRRRFLAFASGAAATAAVAVAGAKPAAAQEQQISDEPFVEVCDTMVVYRLRETWTEPRGPKGKTELESKASRTAAKHRWALNEQDALDMNLHKCSYAPAEAVIVGRDAFMKIWDDGHSGFYTWQNPWNGKAVDIFDSRCLEHIDNGDELWNEAFNAPCVGGSFAEAARRASFSLGGGPTVNSTTTTTVTSTSATPTATATARATETATYPSAPAAMATARPTPTATTAPAGASASIGANATLRQTPEQLAFTGNSTTPVVAGGTALVLLGAVSLRASRMEKMRLARIEANPQPPTP